MLKENNLFFTIGNEPVKGISLYKLDLFYRKIKTKIIDFSGYI
jgi:hypothetical protein